MLAARLIITAHEDGREARGHTRKGKLNKIKLQEGSPSFRMMIRLLSWCEYCTNDGAVLYLLYSCSPREEERQEEHDATRVSALRAFLPKLLLRILSREKLKQ